MKFELVKLEVVMGSLLYDDSFINVLIKYQALVFEVVKCAQYLEAGAAVLAAAWRKLSRDQKRFVPSGVEVTHSGADLYQTNLCCLWCVLSST